MNSEAILSLWVRGHDRSPAGRALLLLEAVAPERSQEALAAMSVNDCDAELLSLRERFFGPELRAFANCPACHEHLEYTLKTEEIRRTPGEASAACEWQLEDSRVNARYRLPTLGDLTAIERVADVETARRGLLERCVTLTDRAGGVLRAGELLPAEITRIADGMEAHAPQADVHITLVCPACGNRWQSIFDVGTYLWAEIQACAHRLLSDVAVLARAFGWSERDILQMSAYRRQCYRELASL